MCYLLHGLSDDSSKWLRRSRVEQHAQQFPFLVAMPDGFRGAYANNEAGPRFFDYMIEDVVGAIERLFDVRGDRGGRCVGGLSMGGYGALRLALGRPDLFNSAVSHSGALLWGNEPADKYEGNLAPGEYARVFGQTPAGSGHDLFVLAKKPRRRKR